MRLIRSDISLSGSDLLEISLKEVEKSQERCMERSPDLLSTYSSSISPPTVIEIDDLMGNDPMMKDK